MLEVSLKYLMQHIQQEKVTCCEKTSGVYLSCPWQIFATKGTSGLANFQNCPVQAVKGHAQQTWRSIVHRDLTALRAAR